MFQSASRRTAAHSAFSLLELIYHTTVRSIRKSDRNAIIGLAYNMMQAMILVIVFFVMFTLLGLRGVPLRGDFVLYLMSGIFLFLTHIKTVTAVMGAAGPTSAMMQHAPMNTLISICSSALSVLYMQILTLVIILTLYHIVWAPVSIDDPISAMGAFLLAWYAGVGVGLVLLALKPWMPRTTQILKLFYNRANMIASGKAFVANALPASKVALFDWNPLFHCIDQARGFVFLHYNPHYSSWKYALIVATILIVIGYMGEFFARKHASASWSVGK